MSEEVKEEEKKAQLWHCLKRKRDGIDMTPFTADGMHMSRHGCTKEDLVECTGPGCANCPV